MRDERLAKTMRIDLIPDVASEHARSSRRRVRITSQKKRRPQEEAPKQEAERVSRYEELLQSIYDAALITDTNGQIVDVNERAVEFFRYKRKHLLGVNIVDLLSGAESSLVETVLENLENHRFTLIQAYCVRRDGSHFSSEIAVNRIDLGETRLGFFARDITLRRQAEEMLRTEHNAIHNSGNGIAVADLAARLEYVNPAMTRMWGFGADDEFLGTDVRALFGEPAKAGKMIDTVLQDQKNWSGEVKAVRKDGEKFHVQISAACNRNSDGDPVGVVFSFVDISDRRRAVDAEREAERQRVMLESLGAVCHHMGQPATVLLANLGLVQAKVGDAGKDVEDLVDSCLAAAENLGEILHRLNAVNEYKTTRYLDGGEEGVSFAEESRILDINGGKSEATEQQGR
jgi:PAS domain S-box-containing protein